MTRAKKNELLESFKIQIKESESKVRQAWVIVKEKQKKLDWYIQVGQLQGAINDMESMLEIAKGIKEENTKIFHLEKNCEYLEDTST